MKETKTDIGSQLRTVDKLIKADQLNEALDVIVAVIESDAKNVYARAYHERITDLLRVKSKAASGGQSVSPVPVPQPKPAAPLKETHAVSQKFLSAAVEAYEKLLHEVWINGDVTEADQSKILEMKEAFGISDTEHEYLEQKIRVTHLLKSVKAEFTVGNKDLNALYGRFKITKDEQYILEVKIGKIIDSARSNATILALDDEPDFLKLMPSIMARKGYACFTTSSAEEALELLDEINPDLIVCDIAFGNDRMNGFMFYEKFRSLKSYSGVPFIFVTGINQEKMIEIGKRLGADDYLIKPVEPNILLATIEGKLKRSRELRTT